MTDAYEDFLTETDEIEPFTAEWFKILAKYSTRLIAFGDLTDSLQEQITSGGGGESTAYDFGTFLSPVEFTLDMGTY